MEKIDFDGSFEVIIKNDKDLIKKYHKALQEVQRERNALRAENEQLKQQLAELDSELAENVRENEWLKEKLAESDDCADRYWKQLGVLEEENNQLKQQLADKKNESVGPKYFLVRNKITGKYLDFETDDYYSGFGELSGATVFDEELYSYLNEEHKKDTYKVYIYLFK